jgi:type II secretory pathway predicted ATPase ExeA/LysM repeat protein
MATSPTFVDFYQLREQPFGVTPDPNYLYLSPGHREALASLVYGIETGRGFLSLVAEPGMGKTTLLFQLLQRWRGYVHSAFLFQTQCSSREFIRYLLTDLGLRSDGEDIVRMHSELNQFLFREQLAGRQVVVFIDEAQNLSDAVLETVRLLSDFEATDKKLIQIVLAGQPKLEKRLSHLGLAQLRQRITIQARLDALPPTEVIRYIIHRLHVAGHPGAGLFTPGAFELIAEHSRGIPRVINNLCFNALSLGCALQSEQITCELIRRTAAELSLGPRPRPHPAPSAPPVSRLTRGPRPSLESLYSWCRDHLIKHRIFRTAAASAVAGSLAIYLGMHSGSGTTQSASETHRIIASAQKAPESESPPARTASGNFEAVSKPDEPQTGRGEGSHDFFTYVVKPEDTLRDLCMSTVGRYDNVVLTEIQKLNPQLRDPNHLEVGQEIHFPVNYPK